LPRTTCISTRANEYPDLDSIFSAVLFAYLHTYISPTTPQTVHIPLCNLLRQDLSLRPELQPVLSRAHLASNDLLTLSDLPPRDEWKTRLQPQNTSWLLVDHNDLNGDLGTAYGERVVGVIDHHDEEHKVPNDTGPEPRVVQKCGSCTSLVIQYYKSAWDAASSSSSSSSQSPQSSPSQSEELKTWDKQLAYLALAPILIDTSNLRDASKTTSTDIEAVRFLESHLTGGDTEPPYSRDAYFSELSDAKTEIGCLAAGDVLRKDYKQWAEGPQGPQGEFRLGISSVVRNLEWYVVRCGGRDKFLETVYNFAKERDLSLHAIMTTATVDGKFQRELFVFGADELGCRVVESIEGDVGKELGLGGWGEGRLDGMGRGTDAQRQVWRCWTQAAVEKSRKQVGPLLRAVVNKSLDGVKA
jgi:exopolyphosphatase